MLNIPRLIEIIIETALCFIFVSVFIEKESKKINFASITTASLAEFIFNYMPIYIPVPYQVKYILNIAIIVLIQFIIYRKYFVRLAIMTFTYMFFLALIGFSTDAVLSFLSGREYSYFRESFSFMYLGMFIKIFLSLLLVFYVKRKFEPLQKPKTGNLLLIFAVSLAGVLFAFYLYDNSIKINLVSKTDATLFVFLQVIEVLVLYCFSETIKSNENETKLNMMNLYNTMLHKSAEEEKHNFDLWSIRVHDYKNHLIYMLELLEQKEYEKLKKTLQEESGTFECRSDYVQSGYEGIDAIINSKMMNAESRGIHVLCNIKLPGGLIIDEGAFTAILGNLLDNAIRKEMSQNEKLIEIHIDYIRGNLYAKIVNHKEEGEIDFEASSKENSKWHGIGLKSVRHQVRKMKGEFTIMQEKTSVVALVVLYDVKKL